MSVVVSAIAHNGALVNKAAYAVISHPVVRSALFYVLEAPLLALFLHGPRLAGYGFFEGKPLHEICGELTGVPASHWVATAVNASDCEQLVERKFNSFLVGSYFCLYGACLVSIVTALVRRTCCYKRRARAKKNVLE